MWSSQEKIYRSIYVTIFWLNWISCRVQKLSPVVCPCNTSRDSVLNLIENKNLCYFLQYSLFSICVLSISYTFCFGLCVRTNIYLNLSLSLSLSLSLFLSLSLSFSLQSDCPFPFCLNLSAKGMYYFSFLLVAWISDEKV